MDMVSRWGVGRSWKCLQCFQYQALHIMLQASKRVRLNCHILRRKLLPFRRPHHSIRDLEALLFRRGDRERERLSWLHGQVTRESPAGTREVPNGALPLDWSSVVRDRAVRGDATERANGEGNRSLAGRVF